MNDAKSRTVLDWFRNLRRQDTLAVTIENTSTTADLATETTLQNIETGVDGLETLIGTTNTSLTTSNTNTGNSATSLATIVSSFTPSQFRSLTVNSTAQVVKATSGNLHGWNIINLSPSTIYVKIYNIAAASVNPASSVPVRTLQVPSGGSLGELSNTPWNTNSTAISVRAVTEAIDTGTTAPVDLPIIELIYK